jgi:hypothetical protein
MMPVKDGTNETLERQRVAEVRAQGWAENAMKMIRQDPEMTGLAIAVAPFVADVDGGKNLAFGLHMASQIDNRAVPIVSATMVRWINLQDLGWRKRLELAWRLLWKKV